MRLQLQQHRASFLVPCVSRTVTPSVHSTSAFHTLYSSGSRGEAGVVNFVWRWCDWVLGLSAPSYSWVPTCVTQSLKRYPRCGVKGARFAICLPFSSEYSVSAAWAWLIMQGYCICLVHVVEWWFFKCKKLQTNTAYHTIQNLWWVRGQRRILQEIPHRWPTGWSHSLHTPEVQQLHVNTEIPECRMDYFGQSLDPECTYWHYSYLSKCSDSVFVNIGLL